MRRHCTFDCEGVQLVGTLDTAEGETGLLIVSGGNEIRSGAWAGQAMLAARVASAGHPAFRFDRRGIGDSAGENRGFLHSAPDIGAAIGAFRQAAPQVRRIIGFGNCDAAAALMLGAGFGLAGLALANPWTSELAEDDAQAPAALRAHYWRRLRDPAALKRLMRGAVSPGPLVRSLAAAVRPAPERPLVQRMRDGLSAFAGPVSILLAERDRTGQVFQQAWDRADPRLRRCPGATHSFVEPDAREWLTEQILMVMQATSG